MYRGSSDNDTTKAVSMTAKRLTKVERKGGGQSRVYPRRAMALRRSARWAIGRFCPRWWAR